MGSASWTAKKCAANENSLLSKSETALSQNVFGRPRYEVRICVCDERMVSSTRLASAVRLAIRG